MPSVEHIADPLLLGRAEKALVTPSSSTPTRERAADMRTKVHIERLVNDHYDFVWRSARRLGVRSADLDDVVQEVFLVAADRVHEIKHELGFLFRTCMFVASHMRRSTQRRREVSDDAVLEFGMLDERTPEQSAETAEALAQLHAILEDMPETLRAVFVLFELEQFTMSEIAETLDIPPGTVASRLRKAREIFLARTEGDTHAEEALSR
ncbi:RNA polymerase sigma factor RpoE [Labilithrix luteola]|uniref:RNA polymerase sigma factor RpoE n=1 Tax=Labilithrix luteola TaxID=1391654 RepID=A0A0K1PMT5_9BACT|nr:sigma-70 family RNA polymerase sigma factor [Labilithrix luteola]AKU94850.1 RNA polymerase sigma factor RpoE [Labilithrix luteola]